MYFSSNHRKKMLCATMLVGFYIPIAYLPTAHADWSFKKLSPFVGVEYGHSSVKMQKDFGDKMFRKNVHGYNFFAGIDLREFTGNDLFGLEIGYMRDNKRRDSPTLVAGDHIPGEAAALTALLAPAQFATSMRTKNKYIGLTAKYPIFECLDISFLVGLSRNTVKAQHTLLQSPQFPGGASNTDIANNLLRRNYKKHKLLPMLRLGLQYKFNDNFSVRANSTWIRTSRVNINSAENGRFRPNAVGGPSNATNNQIKLKNSMWYTIGLVVNFL